MKYILILEDDERIKKELFDTIKGIDPQFQIRFFKDLEQFHNWLKIAMNEGPLSLAKAGTNFSTDTSTSSPNKEDTLRLVIAKDEFLGTQNMSLIRRARDFFIRKNLCTQFEPTSLVLTAFDSPSFDILLAEERIINNVIFKPFDKLILKQHLEFAIGGRHPLDGSTISTIQVSDKIEMLKRSHFVEINETGFTTKNNHAISIGAITKYYADIFTANTKRSILAYCNSCTQNGPEDFTCQFLFFAAEPAQATSIRKHILQNPKHQLLELKTQSAKAKTALILEEDINSGLELENLLKQKFSNIDTFVYSSMGQLLADLADKDTVHRKELPNHFDLLFANLSFMPLGEKDKSWEQFVQFCKERAKRRGSGDCNPAQIYLTSKKSLSAEEIRKHYPWSKDIFFYPLDRAYFSKKIFTLENSLISNESITNTSYQEEGVIKIANTVDISQISEAGLVMKYYRAIGIGSFREFILVRDNETESPEITGTCNFTEEVKGSNPPTVSNHFIFFGMRDHFLKHIRLWLRESYIRQKGDE